MGNIFSGSEVVEVGIQIEKNGRDFYNALIKRVTDNKSKEIFRYLAQEEEKHITVFEKIKEKTQGYQPQGIDSSDYYAYMNSLASEHIFTKKNMGLEAAKSIQNEQDAVEKGIGFEEDSIIFYEGMKKIVPSYEQKIVDELINQEKGHLKKLIELSKMIG